MESLDDLLDEHVMSAFELVRDIGMTAAQANRLTARDAQIDGTAPAVSLHFLFQTKLTPRLILPRVRFSFLI